MIGWCIWYGVTAHGGQLLLVSWQSHMADHAQSSPIIPLIETHRLWPSYFHLCSIHRYSNQYLRRRCAFVLVDFPMCRLHIMTDFKIYSGISLLDYLLNTFRTHTFTIEWVDIFYCKYVKNSFWGSWFPGLGSFSSSHVGQLGPWENLREVDVPLPVLGPSDNQKSRVSWLPVATTLELECRLQYFPGIPSLATCSNWNLTIARGDYYVNHSGYWSNTIFFILLKLSPPKCSITLEKYPVFCSRVIKE